MIGCQIMTKPGWGVVYKVSQHPATPFCTMWLIMTKSTWVVVYNVSLNLVNLLSSMWIIMRSLHSPPPQSEWTLLGHSDSPRTLVRHLDSPTRTVLGQSELLI